MSDPFGAVSARLAAMEQEHADLEARLADGSVATDPAQLGRVGEHIAVGEARLEIGVLLLHRGEAGGDGPGVVGHGATRLQAPVTTNLHQDF